MALASRLSVPSDDQGEDPEDIFSSNLNTLFTDTTVNSHGWPGASIIYSSPSFGDILINIPEQPEVIEDKSLFAHYLWNAALVTAEAIQAASRDDTGSDDSSDETGWNAISWNKEYWNVRECNILELGAGTALPSLIAALSGARYVTITDHPSSPAITTNTIAMNVHTNITKRLTQTPCNPPNLLSSPPEIRIKGYLWGTTTFTPPSAPSFATSPLPPPITAPSSQSHPQPNSQPPPNSFHKILIADCLWRPSQHASLIKTILTYLSFTSLSLSPSSSPSPSALLTAGFHTSRGPITNFLHLATGLGPTSTETPHYDPVDEKDPLRIEVRGKLKVVECFEVDVDGNRRGWDAGRKEGREEAKRWCVVIVLVRKDPER